MSRLLAGLSGANTNSPLGTGYTSICDRTGAVDCYIPPDIMQIEEQTKAAYVMLNFGGANTNIFGQVNVVGNVGVRVVQTKEISGGSVGYPASTNLLALGACTPPLGTNVVNPPCYLTPDLIAFSNGGGSPDTFPSTHTNSLPTFNLPFRFHDNNSTPFASPPP